MKGILSYPSGYTMPSKRKPRSGSLGVWPRVRAQRQYARIRSWAKIKDNKPLGFAGFKVGMTHAGIIDNRPTSTTTSEECVTPVTILECPPLKTFSLVFYKKSGSKLLKIGQQFAKNCDKELKRKISVPKKAKEQQVTEFDEVRLLVHTQPKLLKLKKKPDVFELALGGSSKDDNLTYAKEVLGKEIKLSDVFAEGNQVDIHSITKGKGFQGPVKRFGVKIRARKSEKTKRGPGNLGAWTGNRSWTVAHAGQMGYHQRTDWNKWIIHLGNDVEKINQKGGIKHYGNVKYDYVLLKGSVGGPRKRVIRFNHALRPSSKIPAKAPTIVYIHK